MLLRGNLFLNTNKQIAIQSLNICKIVIIGERDEELVRMCGASVGEVLLPSYRAMGAYVDGNMQAFNQLYMEQLSSAECEEFIAIILKALSNGTNIMLYLTPDEAQIPYLNIFMMYLLNNYGITIATEYNPCSYNQAFDAKILDLIYAYGLLDSIEYLTLYPEECSIMNTYCINRLVNDLRPPVSEDKRNLQGFIEYFNYYKSVLKKTNLSLLNPFIVKN